MRRIGKARVWPSEKSRSKAFRNGIALAVLGMGIALPRAALAATCTVDPTGSSGLPGTFTSVNAALFGGCGSPGSVVEIWCPVAGCTDSDLLISGLTDVTIRSLEAGGGSGPVTLAAVGAPQAVRVTGSTNIRFEGISRYESPHTGVQIEDSEVTLLGPSTGAATAIAQRYAAISGSVQGMLVWGDSKVTARWVGWADSQTGLRMVETPSGEPVVSASGVAFLDNGLAADVAGPPGGCPAASPGTVLDIRSDFETAWLNYVMGNVEGFRLRGRAQLAIDHTVLANNLVQMGPGGTNPVLFEVLDSSRLEARNVLVFDNDMLPGLTLAFAGGFNVAGIILQHLSCAESIFTASTVVNNASDLVFGIDGSGRLTLDHTVVAGNWGKVLSMSSWYVSHGNTCPPVDPIAAHFWGNRIDADPAVCLPPPAAGLRTTWNPRVKTSLATPRELAAYPDVVAPWTDLYLIRRRQPVPYALPAALYVDRLWSVNGKSPDLVRLDVGYHNPLPEGTR
jgi:hypothetical protein